MTAPRRSVLELVLAALAAAAAVWAALNVRSVTEVAPIMAGQRPTTSILYDPPLMVLSLLLTAVAGVLAVVAVARWWRAVSST
jgi:NO-binding membrane sensor protein with MHYT domain